MIKKKEDKEEGITESFLGGIPVLGKLVKELGKIEGFKKKFAETDQKIEENLRKRDTKKWSFESNLSVRPIINEIKKETSELSIYEDYFYGRKGNKLTLAVKVPKKEVGLKIERKNLLIDTGSPFPKKIGLPDYYRNIERQKYQKGILVLELTK